MVIDASIKYAAGNAKEVNGKMRANIVVLLPDGQEEKIWGDHDKLEGWKRGDKIRVEFTSKGLQIMSDMPLVQAKHSSSQPQHQAAAAQVLPEAFKTPDVETWGNIKEYLDFVAHTWMAAYMAAQNKAAAAKLELHGEVLERLATTATISAIRRWKLER